VTGTYPKIRQRVFLLGIFCPGDALFIDDPWGLEAETFGACYRQIDEAVACLPARVRTSERSPVAVCPLSQRL